MIKKNIKEKVLFNDEIKNKAIELFNKNLKSKEICEILNISKTSLIRNLNKLGYNFDRTQSKRIYTLNKTYFDFIDSIDKAYFLGLIYADGSNKINKKTFVLALQEEDKYILETFKIYLGYNNTLKKDKLKSERHKIIFRLVVFSKYFCNSLLKQGVFQNKTFILNEPNIDEKFYFHFLRGYFDGDGSLVTTVNKKNYKNDCLSITGTKEICLFFEKIVKKININTCINKRHPLRNNNNYTIRINGRKQILKFCELLYNDKQDLFFERKYNKFIKIKNRYENR